MFNFMSVPVCRSSSRMRTIATLSKSTDGSLPLRHVDSLKRSGRELREGPKELRSGRDIRKNGKHQTICHAFGGEVCRHPHPRPDANLKGYTPKSELISILQSTRVESGGSFSRQPRVGCSIGGLGSPQTDSSFAKPSPSWTERPYSLVWDELDVSFRAVLDDHKANDNERVTIKKPAHSKSFDRRCLFHDPNTGC